MTPGELQKRRVLSFLALAEEELAVAIEIREKHNRQAAYFLQQSVEKLVRGVLETETIPAGPMHSIRGLAALLPQGHWLRDRFVEFDELSSAATRYRYPSPQGGLSGFNEDRLRHLIVQVKHLLDEVSPILRNFVPRDDTNARN
ncbi:MAG: HEPN domain-containing protein [Allorhizobium sp.]